MNNIEAAAAAISLCMALAAVTGIAIVRSAIKKKLKSGSAERFFKLFKEQAAKARQEIISIKKVRSALNAGNVKKELAEGISLIRNRIAACDGERLTTDVMLDELMAESDVLRYPYARMLSLVRTEERGRAVNEFSELVKNKDSEEYARIIVMLDDMEPSDMYDSVVAFQKTMKEERITEIKKRDEALSDLLYLPVVFDLLLVFFNFLYVAYFTQQKDMLGFFM